MTATQTQKATKKSPAKRPNSTDRIKAEVLATQKRKAQQEAKAQAAEAKKIADEKARTEGLANTAKDLQSVNDLDKAEADLIRHLGNGAAAARDFAIMVHACVSRNNDTRPIARVMGRVRFPKNRKGDMQAFNAMRKIMGYVYPGAEPPKFTAKNRSYSITVKGIKADTEALARLTSGVYDGLQLRDTLVSRVRGPREEPTEHQKLLGWTKKHTKVQSDKAIEALRERANKLEKLQRYCKPEPKAK